MKKILIVFLAVLAVVTLAVPTVALAFTSSVLNNPTYTTSQNGFVYKEATVLEGSANRKIYYGEYNPTVENAKYEFVLHSVRNGSTTTRTTVLNIAKDYEQKTGRKVVMATNGDYFDYGTGANMESYVVDGVVVSKGAFVSKHCIGFDNNGKVAVGRMVQCEPRLRIYDAQGQRRLFEIDTYNAQPSSGKIAIYNQSRQFTVQNCGVMIVTTDSANLTNYPVLGKFEVFRSLAVQASQTFTLQSGQFAVVYDNVNEPFFNDMSHYGKSVDLVEVPAGQFEGCTWVVGGYDILIDNGVVGSNFHTDNDGNANRARTFIGFKQDGTAFLCVVDETGGSTGITVTKEAELANVLGAKYALELDGGGSSTMVIRVGNQLTVRNKSIDGASMRPVSNAVLLVEKQDSGSGSGGNDPDPVVTQRTLTVGDKSFTVDQDKFVYNTAVATSNAASKQMIVYDKDYTGTFTTNAYGAALVFNQYGKLVKIYDGAYLKFYDENGVQSTNLTFNNNTYATVAFSELAEGEILVITPNDGSTNLARAFALSLTSYVGQKGSLTGIFEDLPEPIARVWKVGNSSLEIAAGKSVVNEAVTSTSIVNFDVVVFNEDFDGTFGTKANGIAFVFDSTGNLVKIYDGSVPCFYDSNGKKTSELTFNRGTYAKVAFSELAEGETLVICVTGGAAMTFGANICADGVAQIGQRAFLTGIFGTDYEIVTHECEHVCQTCGKCTDLTCDDAVCAEKCPGHEPPHVCDHVCPECNKCTDATCENPVCADKCQGHVPVVPPHECGHICQTCGKCTDSACTDAVCAEKCPGHEPPHVCEHICTECHKCMDATCENPVCADKCQGHTPVVPPHVCGHICETCGKCTDLTCDGPVCAEKCQGHEVIPPQPTEKKDLVLKVGNCSITVEKEKYAVNAAVTHETISAYDVVVYDKTYQGEDFTTTAYGMAMVFDSTGKLVKIYDGKNTCYYDLDGKHEQNLTFNRGTYAKVAFSELAEGETLVIFVPASSGAMQFASEVCLQGAGQSAYMSDGFGTDYEIQKPAAPTNKDKDEAPKVFETTDLIVVLVVCGVVVIASVVTTVVLLKRKNKKGEK